MTPHEFLDFVFDDKTDDEVICVSKGSPQTGGKTLFWNVAPDHEAFAGWASHPHRAKQAWYFCVSTVGGTLNEKGTALKRRRDDLVRYHCFVLDDIGTKAETPPVEPAWKIESSEGNYQWGYLLDPDDNWERYEALLEWAHDRGWGDAGAGGAYRLMRVPGSANLKPGRDKFLSEVEICDDIIWPLDELGAALGADLKEIAKAVRGMVRDKPRGAETDDGELDGELDGMLTWLAENDHVVGNLDKEFVTVRCPWGDEHTDGNTDASYSPLGRGSKQWVKKRGFKCHHAHCVGRSFSAFLDWAMGEGCDWYGWHDPLPWLQRRWVYLEAHCRFADLDQRPFGGHWVYSERAWANMNPHRIPALGHDRPVITKTAFLESYDTTTATDVLYLPGQDEIGTADLEDDGNKQEFVNSYIEIRHEETDEEPMVFLEHIDFLLPDPAERECFLDWLAKKIQEPASRSYAVVMIADEVYGVGRSWLGGLLDKITQGKVNNASLKQLVGKGTQAENNYNDWAAECQFLVIEEAKDVSRQDFWDSYTTFKSRIDIKPTKFTANPKYGHTRTDLMYFNALIFSNHADAMVIPSKDRRVAAFTNPRELRDKDYYERLWTSLKDDEPARVYWWLMRRDVSKYDHVWPPNTPARSIMIEMSRSPADEITTWLDENLEGDIVTRKCLEMRVRAAARELGHEKIATEPGGVTGRIWRKLGSLRPSDTNNGARYLIDTKREQVRAVREWEKWRKIDEGNDRDIIIGELKKNIGEVAHLNVQK